MDWIRVKDRMPPEGEIVLVVTDYCGYKQVDYYVAWFGDEGIWKMWDAVDESGWAIHSGKFCKVTHWMPCPQLPKGD